MHRQQAREPTFEHGDGCHPGKVARDRAARVLCNRDGLHSIVEGAAHSASAAPDDVSIDLGGADIGVAELLLHRADVGPAFEKVGGKGMTQ